MIRLLAILLLSLACLAQTHTSVTVEDAQTITGAKTMSGANLLTAKTLNSIRYADQFTGATADVKINAAIADLGSGGGVVDARGLTGDQSIAAKITVGTNTDTNSSGIELLLPCTDNTTWTITATGGVHVFDIGDGSHLKGCGGRRTRLAVGSSANIADVISFVGNPANSDITSYARVSSIEITGHASATVTNGLMNLQNSYDGIFSDVKLAGPAACLLYIADTSSVIAPNSNDFYTLMLEGSNTTSTVPLCVKSTAGGNIGPIRFFGGDWGHPGAGKSVAKFERSGAGTSHPFAFSLDGVYIETNSAETTTAVFDIADTAGFAARSVYINRLNASSTQAGFAFSDSGSNQMSNVTLDAVTITGGSNCTNTVTSSVTNIPAASACTLNKYFGHGNDSNGKSILTTPTISDPTFSGVVNGTLGNSGTALMHYRGDACTTAASAFATCTQTITWPGTWANTNYTATCTVENASNLPVVVDFSSRSTTQITVKIAALTAAAATGTLNCIGVHD